MIALALLAMAECLAAPAQADRMTAGDLAAASPAFAALPVDTVLGWAPAPGAPRVFHRAELRRLAARLGMPSVPEADLCVERRLEPLDPARLLAALQAELPDARLELVDFSRQPAPQGALVFPRSGLRWNSSVSCWNGYVRYAGTHRFAVWAKVRVRLQVPVVVAVEDLPAGRPLQLPQLRLENRDDGRLAGAAGSLAEVVGKQLRRSLRAGTVIPAQALEAPPAVQRGETVTVEVWSGRTRLELRARAESAGAAGQRIALRNPVSQRRFWGRVEGPGRASVKEEKP